jgi:hypothetical protein
VASGTKDCELCGGIGFFSDGIGSVTCPECGGTGVQPGQEKNEEE